MPYEVRRKALGKETQGLLELYLKERKERAHWKG